MIRLDRSEGLDHCLGHPMFAVLFRRLVGATKVASTALGRNDDQGRSELNVYSIKAPCLRKISSWMILSGIPWGFKTVFPQRIRIS